MAEAVATMPRVFLGEALKQLRADAGISLDAAAAHVGKNRQRLIRLLEGKATLTADELGDLVTFLGATGRRRREIVALGAEARKAPTGDPYTDIGPGSYRRVAYLEAKAETILSYEKGIFPALIQSPEYVDALMIASEGIWWDESTEQGRSSRVAFRLERQRVVFDAEKPKQVHLLFTDDAFWSGVGSRDVMRRQIEHLRSVIKKHENLTIQIVPADAWNNPAQHGGITVFGFGDLLRPVGFLPVVYGPSTYFDKAEDTNRLSRAFNRLRELSMSPEETLATVDRKLREI